MIQPCCLTIAGSDAGGNAGVQADLRTFHAYRLHGCTVFTALTAQNPFSVSAIHPLPPDFIHAQLTAVLNVYNIRALKIGMLHQPETIEVIAHCLRNHPEIAKVIDPVMIASSGARLMTSAAIHTLKTSLLPLATLITPNLPEAEALTGLSITNDAAAQKAARTLYDAYGAAIILKGGHFEGPHAQDLLYDGHAFTTAQLPRIDHPISTHGTGCTFAAALTAELTLGASIPAAFQQAKRHVYHAIQSSFWVGKDCGVLGFVNATPPS